MVRRFATPVNARDRPQSRSRESWLKQRPTSKCLPAASALRSQFQIALQQPAGRTLGLAGAAEELAFEPIETVGRREETVAAGIAHDDAGRLSNRLR